jgi:hypothetical protein
VYGLDIKDSISWVHSSLVLGRFTNQALLVGEGNERWGGKTTLLVGDDFNIGALIVGNWLSISIYSLGDYCWKSA